MLLFLDVVSPIPEFSVIEDNKLILNKKITKKPEDKLSDCIFQIYLEIEENFDLLDKLEKIAITSGPGSYTSLRVGSAFISAINISRNIQFSQISAIDIINFKSKDLSNYKTGIYIESANNQKFFCSVDGYGKKKYNKIENDKFEVPKEINKIFYNFEKLNLNNRDIKQVKFSFVQEVILNYKNLNFNTETNAEPIYISNNNILN